MGSTFEMGYESGYVAGWEACRKLIRQRYELMLTLGPLADDWEDAPKREPILIPGFQIGEPVAGAVDIYGPGFKEGFPKEARFGLSESKRPADDAGAERE